ncbi:MAG: type IV conjugative transfer system protein TraE [Proteobacteria bacterium]|nr:type IV conjugative transfer system protein TraE [Pseudomonadota bacterium]
MDTQNRQNALSQVIRQRNIAVLGFSVSVVIILLLSLTIFFKDRLVVISPSVISQEYRISSNNVSRGYLEDMTRDVIATMFNLTPSNVNYMTDSLLKMVHPRAYGQVRGELLKIQEDVIERRVSTTFYPITMDIAEKVLKVRVEGDFHTFIGNKMSGKERRTFEIAYIYSGTKLTIGGFHEVVEDSKDGKDNNNG